MPSAPGADRGEERPEGPERIRVILVEDEGLYRDLLRVSLHQSPGIEVVGAFPDGESALAQAPALQPHVALLDIELGPGPNGVQVGYLLRRRLPGLGIVLLSHHRDPAYLTAVPRQELGGWSYLLKASVADLDALERAIRGAAAGFVVLDPRVVTALEPRRQGRLAGLTHRQMEILGLMAQGYQNAAIAGRLKLALKTVENAINAIYDALDVDRGDGLMHPRVQAVLAYLDETRPTPPAAR